MEDKASPFLRRDILLRLPPRARAGSMSEIEERVIAESTGKIVEQASKRKRTDETNDAISCNPNLDQLQRVFAAIHNQVKQLEKVLANMYKPPQDLKDISKGKQGVQAEVNIQNLEVYYEECTKAKNRNNRRSTIAQSYEVFHTISEEDWLGECTKAKNRNNRRSTIAQSYEVFHTISEEDWLGDILPKIIEDQNAINNFGGKLGLLKQQKRKGEVAVISHSLGYPDESGNFKETKRFLYYPIIADRVLEKETEDKDMYRALETVQQLMIQNEKNKLVVPEMDGVVGTVFNRMVRYLFFNTNISVHTYTAEGTQRRKAMSMPAKPHSKNLNADEAKIPKQKKGHLLVVNIESKSYADLLRTVRARSTPDKAETLKREIAEKLPSAVAAKVVTNKVLHIKGLDEVTTLEEVVDPAFGNKENVTVIMPAAAADKLIRMQKIKIGWMRCRIVEREEEKKCYRCWEHEHFKVECKGPNRERLCMKCAGEGHKANECQLVLTVPTAKGKATNPGALNARLEVTKIRGHVLL
ncbi:hypothetical protein QE152_g5882 [Popillia japonica]|uniref:CCHC-type domain-containing protein n=1 Tax=Popillia japonica TaxID=7064 RepID=A0AAW1MKS9_POPJA